VYGAPQNPAQIDDFAILVGTQPTIIMWYQQWGSADSDFEPAAFAAVRARGAMPMVTWMPCDPNGGPIQPAFALRTIIAGVHDAYIDRWARAAAAMGQPMYLRFAHEMNGGWYSWAPGINGNSGADYVAAWRHVHDIFQRDGATNVRWVWSPNVMIGAGPSAAMYPGDAYVDWVGLDGYNWGPIDASRRWQRLADIFGPSYDALTKITNKPVMIAETASTEAGGDKAGWIRQGLLTDVPERLPKVRAVIWFDENKEADWRPNSSGTALATFQEAARSTIYRGRLS